MTGLKRVVSVTEELFSVRGIAGRGVAGKVCPLTPPKPHQIPPQNKGSVLIVRYEALKKVVFLTF